MRKRIVGFSVAFGVLALLIAGAAAMAQRARQLAALEPSMRILAAIEGDAWTRFIANLVLRHGPALDIGTRTLTDQSLLQFVLAGYEADGPAKNARVLKVAKFLVTQGIDPNTHGPLGLAALHDAVLFDGPPVVTFLLDIGADPDRRAGRGPYEGLTPTQLLERLRERDPGRPRRDVEVILRKAVRAGGAHGDHGG